MSRPLVSIIIPTFNSEKYIEDCLVSLKYQDMDPQFYEIIIVDSGYDNTENICKKYKTRYFHNDKCNSAGLARNYGITKANGGIIAFIDSDCVAPKNWLNQIIDTFKEYPEIVGILGYYTGGDNLLQKVINGEFSKKKNIGFHKGMREGNTAFKKQIFEEGCRFGEYKWSEGNVLIRQVNDLGYKTLSDHTLRITHRAIPKRVIIKNNFSSGRANFFNAKKYLNFGRFLLISLFFALSLVCLFLFFLANSLLLLAPFILINAGFTYYIFKSANTPFKYLLIVFPYLLLERWFFWSGFFYQSILQLAKKILRRA